MVQPRELSKTDLLNVMRMVALIQTLEGYVYNAKTLLPAHLKHQLTRQLNAERVEKSIPRKLMRKREKEVDKKVEEFQNIMKNLDTVIHRAAEKFSMTDYLREFSEEAIDEIETALQNIQYAKQESTSV